MALFGKKKGADAPPPAASTTPASLASAAQRPASTENGAFDFDEIARDLDASGGASSFDSLLSEPVNTPAVGAPAHTTHPESNSAFDFPEFEHEPTLLNESPGDFSDFSTDALPTKIEPTFSPLPESAEIPAVPMMPDAPFVAEAPIAVPVQAPVERVRPEGKPKKSFPLIPLLGALATLAVLGGGAMFFMKSQNAPLDTDTPAPVVPRHPAKKPPANQVDVVHHPKTPPKPAPHLASPGIAPHPPKTLVNAPKPPSGGSKVPVRVAVNVPKTSGGIPSATAGLDAGLTAHLKALWQAGADAKHRKNFKEARDAWQEALRLNPGHPGFAEAIARLPK